MTEKTGDLRQKKSTIIFTLLFPACDLTVGPAETPARRNREILIILVKTKKLVSVTALESKNKSLALWSAQMNVFPSQSSLRLCDTSCSWRSESLPLLRVNGIFLSRLIIPDWSSQSTGVTSCFWASVNHSPEDMQCSCMAGVHCSTQAIGKC